MKNEFIVLWPLSIFDFFQEFFTLHSPKQNIRAVDGSKKLIRGVY